MPNSHASIAVTPLSSALLVALLLPLSATADDLEVYSPPLDTNFKPTLMFMIDTSGSMRTEQGGPSSGWRRDRLINPLIDYVRSATGVRAGLSAFNGDGRGGAVIAAAVDLDLDLCPNANCGSVSLRAPVLRSSDDALEQLGSGVVQRGFTSGVLGQSLDDRSFVARSIDQPDGTVLESASGGVVAAEGLTAFRNAAGETTAIGLRFPRWSIPADAIDATVNVTFGWDGNAFLDPDVGEGSGVAKARITLDSRLDAPAFSNEPGHGVTGRPTVAGHVDWDIKRPLDWRTAGDDSDPRLYSPNLISLFEQVHVPGSSGSVTLMMEPVPGSPTEKLNMVSLLGYSNRLNGLRPYLRYTYTDPDKVKPDFVNAFRFDRLKVPRGARITSAHLEVTSLYVDTSPIDLQISAERSGNAAPYGYAANALTSRALTTDHVPWVSDDPWYTNRRHATPDVSGLVQQIVSRSDWCSGNALAFQIRGTGERVIRYMESGDLNAASLHISYDPSTLDPASACSVQPSQDALRLASEGDVQQSPGAAPIEGLPNWEASSTDQRLLGLRFKGVNLGADDEVAEAELTLSTTGSPRDDATFTVWVDSDTPQAAFDASTDLYARRDGEPGIQSTSRKLADGARVTTDDLAELVQHAIDDPGWVRGNDIVLIVAHDQGTDVSLATSAATQANGPSLRIARRVRGAAARDVPLRTARDRLVETLQTLPATGKTPLLDAFYETSQYISGAEVVHGRQRGEQDARTSQHRLSEPASWTGGTLERPADCDPDNLDSIACIGERISGSPVYTAPPSSECRVNQIVLVTDGSPTVGPSDSPARIDALTGQGSCQDKPAGQACFGSLAGWLNDGAPGRPAVRVNTIGFSFQSALLEHVAEAGGGKAFSVTSAGALSQALEDIGGDRTDDSFGLSAPAVSVSRFNRSTHREDVYLGLFKTGRPAELWPGNIKRYALGTPQDGVFGLVDAEGKAAIDPETGGFVQDARSFWTPSPDGALIELGGAAGKLPVERKILTWPAPSKGNQQGARDLVAFHQDNDAIRAADLGVAVAERLDTIRWLQGFDAFDADGDSVTDEPRRRLGAAFHTTPTVIDYPAVGSAVDPTAVPASNAASNPGPGPSSGSSSSSSSSSSSNASSSPSSSSSSSPSSSSSSSSASSSPSSSASSSSPGSTNSPFNPASGQASAASQGRSVVFAATQEGMLHGIDTATGRELFAFLPFELYANAGAFLKTAPGPMRYGLDGPVTSWISDENRNGIVDGSEQAYVTVGMRRGGGHYYTLNVTDPDNPSLAWSIDASRPGFSALGQSWSAMQQARLRIPADASGATVRPALVFGNGYHPVNDARDPDPAKRGANDRGSIYLIDPRTGDLLHHLDAADNTEMVRSIPSEVAVLDLDFDGITDLLMVGDMGGHVWRVDLPVSAAGASAPALSLAARLGNPSDDPQDATAANDRRFFHSPDVAMLTDPFGTTTLGMSIGSGRRDDPLGTSITDRIVLLKLGRAATSTVDESDLADASDSAATRTASARGWYVDLDAPGEKVLGTPVILNGRVLVNSYVPPGPGGDPCKPDPGTGRFNVLNVFDGAPDLELPDDSLAQGVVRSIELATPGIPPSVTVVLSAERPGAPAVMAGTQFIDAVEPGPSRRMTYWISD